MNLPYKANTETLLFSRYEIVMGTKDTTSMKNLLIHSALLDLYYRQKRHIPLKRLLSNTPLLQKFTLVEIASAKIYSNLTISSLPQYNSLEVFLTMCIIFKKYWNDFSLKNKEEVPENTIPLKKLNRIEAEILRVIDYSIVITKPQIQREIDHERSIDRRYRRAMATIGQAY